MSTIKEFEGLKPNPVSQTDSTMSFLIEIPTLPNFVKLKGYESSASIPVEHLSENQIRNLGGEPMETSVTIILKSTDGGEQRVTKTDEKTPEIKARIGNSAAFETIKRPLPSARLSGSRLSGARREFIEKDKRRPQA